MPDLDARIRDWRRRKERETSLSPRELDELEDHLRARVALELELNALLTPTEAFAIARRELGRPAAVEREFAKAGRPRWRRWLVAGWAMFAVSFALPVVPDFPRGEWVLGWEAALIPAALWTWGLPETFGETLSMLSSLTNFLMLATLLELRAARPHRTPWLAGLVSAAAVLNLQWLVGWAEPAALPPLGMGIGYWAWTASFLCVGAGLWMRAGALSPAEPIAGAAA